MTSLVITAANVKRQSSTRVESRYNAGATIAQGKSVYLDTTAGLNKWKLSQGDGTALEANCRGVALNSASDDQPLDVAIGGDVAFGAILEVGMWYGVGNTAGAIDPITDFAANRYHSLIMWARTTSIAEIRPHAASVQCAVVIDAP